MQYLSLRVYHLVMECVTRTLLKRKGPFVRIKTPLERPIFICSFGIFCLPIQDLFGIIYYLTGKCILLLKNGTVTKMTFLGKPWKLMATIGISQKVWELS